jgi:hypothetical protein
MTGTTGTVPADVFETIHDEHTRFPFFESEDATIIGGGHHDKAEFATLVTQYDRMMSGEDWETTADAVEWRYALPEDKDGEWWFAWSQNGERVTAETPGAIAITMVQR